MILTSCVSNEKTITEPLPVPEPPFYGREFKTSEKLPDYKAAMAEVFELYTMILESEEWYETYIKEDENATLP